MKKLVAARKSDRIIDIPITSNAQRALLNHFIRIYFEVYILCLKITYQFTYVRKKVFNRIGHDRKFAVFTGNPAGRAGLAGK